jgi:hypothetical protein
MSSYFYCFLLLFWRRPWALPLRKVEEIFITKAMAKRKSLSDQLLELTSPKPSKGKKHLYLQLIKQKSTLRVGYSIILHLGAKVMITMNQQIINQRHHNRECAFELKIVFIYLVLVNLFVILVI